ncbi:MAG: hypothetical protein GQ574_02770 [Crocinitomix sp.]|nr:hypothetical protein [Crocinitomix sp.]
MKKIVFILGTALILLSSFSGVLKSAGDDLCKAYFPVDVGTTLTYESYNGKDKLQSSDQMTVTDVIESTASTLIKVNMKSFDKKGEEASSTDVEYICEDGVFKISMESMMDSETMEAYKDMEVTMTQTELEIPSDLTVGQDLPDADIEIIISSSGMQIMKMNVKITERKVEAKESMTTSAGTFECYKFSQTTNMKMMFIDKTYKNVDWYTEGIGSVRSETYTENGKLDNYRVLTNISR